MPAIQRLFETDSETMNKKNKINSLRLYQNDPITINDSDEISNDDVIVYDVKKCQQSQQH